MKTKNKSARNGRTNNTSNRKSTEWFSWLTDSKPRALLVAVFGIVGVVSLIGVSASEYAKPIDPKQVIAGTYNQKPTVIAKNKKTGQVDYKSITESKFVLADGSIICDNGDKTGFVKVGDISKAQLKQIKAESKTVRKDSRIKSKLNVPEVSNSQGVIVSDKGAGKNVALNDTTKKSASILELEASLNSYCSKEAVQKVEREDATDPRLPDTTQAPNPFKENVLSKIDNFITPTVHAAPSTPAGTADYAYQGNQAGLTNQYRAANGLYALRTSNCLNQVAWLQAKRMVEVGYIYHNPNLRNEFIWLCNGEGANQNTWRFISENVGRDGGGGSQVLFNAYVASPGHRDNLVNSTARCQGHAAYRQNNSNQVFHVFVSAKWTGGLC
jgi:uncharacterized protein YkwD